MNRARLSLALGLCLASVPGFAQGRIVGPPKSMAALGDSITRAALSAPNKLESPESSWATGTNPSVDSYYLRLLAISPELAGRNFNASVSGSRIRAIPGPNLQLSKALAQSPLPELFLVLSGANDACSDDVSAMTSVPDFAASVASILHELRQGAPDARILFVSVPDVYQLWSTLHANPTAVSRWDAYGQCATMLGNAASTAPADEERRKLVQQRIADYNAEIRRLCAEHPHCRSDESAVFDVAFTGAEVSTVDYFHPSVEGQARLADVTWNAGFDYSDLSSPVSTATEEKVSDEHSRITFTATDTEGVRGIEFRFPGFGWTTYVAPLDLYTGEKFEFRAVDVNGNTEGTRTYEFGKGASEPPPDEVPAPGTPEPPGGCGGDGCGGQFGTLSAMLAVAGLAFGARRRG